MPRDNRYMYMVHVCFVSVTMWVSVGMFVVERPLSKIVGFEPWSVEVCCVFV